MFVCVSFEGHLGSCGTGQEVESLLHDDIMPEQSQPGVILDRCRNQPGVKAVQEGPQAHTHRHDSQHAREGNLGKRE